MSCHVSVLKCLKRFQKKFYLRAICPNFTKEADKQQNKRVALTRFQNYAWFSEPERQKQKLKTPGGLVSIHTTISLL
jgi:hypothetical protein